MPLDTTRTVQTIGTIVYAPPEQLVGQVSEIDHRSDIYSAIPKALDAVCRKAMMPARIDRYQSVHDFRMDLERWMDGLAVSVHPELYVERASRWMRDHIALVKAASVSLSKRHKLN